jgi:hypothetical protein
MSPVKPAVQIIYLAGGDTFYSVLEELTSFMCSRIYQNALQTEDACILGKMAIQKYRTKVAGSTINAMRTDKDPFLEDLAKWVARRFYGEKAEAKYSDDRRCWEIWK